MSKEDAIGPVTFRERIEIVDVLRGLAVFGILVANIGWFSGYGLIPPSVGNPSTFDQITLFLVHFFVDGKFYSTFSFLFGFGFALQIARAQERGDLTAALFKRRLFWLLVIGLAHAYLFWAGDILSIYAVVGFVLILFRNKPDRSLLKWALILVIIPIFTYILVYALFLAFAPADIANKVNEAQLDFWNQTLSKIPHNTYVEIVTGFNLNMIVGRYVSLIGEMRLPKILAMFLLGFWAYRRSIFQKLSANRDLIQRVLVWASIIGLIGNLAYAALAGAEAPIPPTPAAIVGVVGYAFGVPALALTYIAVIATLWQKQFWHRVLHVLAPVGRMALTNYLMHTIVCSLIFYGYGFGLFGRFGAGVATLIALAIFSCQIVLSAIWLKYFVYGPMEWIWRQLTYGKRLDLRISTSKAVAEPAA